MAGKGAETRYTPQMVDIVHEAAKEMEDDPSFSVFISKPKLAARCGICCEDTLDNWARKHPEFALAMGRFKSAQKDKMITGAMFGKYDASFTKFVLSASYGMSEKAALEVSGDKNAPLAISIVTDTNG